MDDIQGGLMRTERVEGGKHKEPARNLPQYFVPGVSCCKNPLNSMWWRIGGLGKGESLAPETHKDFSQAESP